MARPRLSLAFAFAAALSLVLCPARTEAAACTGDNYRGENPVEAYTTMKAAKGTYPEMHFSKGTKKIVSDTLTAGVKAAADFLGGVTNSSFFVWYYADTDANYKNVNDAYCAFTGETANCATATQYATTAKSSTPVKMAGPGKFSCCDGHNVRDSIAAVFTEGDPVDMENMKLLNTSALLAAHEFSHMYQISKGDLPPAWLMEGSAVHLQAMLAHKFPTLVGSVLDTYKKYYRSGGGRSKSITDYSILFYQSTAGQQTGLKGAEEYGTFKEDATDPKLKVPADGSPEYDVGALAVAFAIKRAKKTSADFWKASELGKGFWNAIPTSPRSSYNYKTDQPSTTPEGVGWKKVFTAFTNDTDMNAFYAAFDAWGKTATAETIQAILEDDADIATMVAVPVDIAKVTTSEKNTPASAKAKCGTGATPSSGTPPSGGFTTSAGITAMSGIAGLFSGLAAAIVVVFAVA